MKRNWLSIEGNNYRVVIGQRKTESENLIGKGGEKSNDIGTLIKSENKIDFINSITESL
jgi:hypothetical protein